MYMKKRDITFGNYYPNELEINDNNEEFLISIKEDLLKMPMNN